MSFLWAPTTTTASGPTVIGDFEGGDIATSDWTNPDGTDWEIQSTVALEGTYSLTPLADFTDSVHATATSARGNEYRCYIRVDDAGYRWLVSHIQDTGAPIADNYHVGLSDNSTLWASVRENGGWGSEASTAVSVTYGTIYQMGIRVSATGITAALYDAGGTELATTSEVADTQYTTGAVACSVQTAGTAYFDYVTERPL